MPLVLNDINETFYLFIFFFYCTILILQEMIFRTINFQANKNFLNLTSDMDYYINQHNGFINSPCNHPISVQTWFNDHNTLVRSV